MADTLENDQINRLWDYKLHVDDVYYDRHNFFLVFHSVLLGIVGVLYSRVDIARPLLKVLAILGISLTIIWGYTQARQKFVIDDLNTYLSKIMPEYQATKERRRVAKWPVGTRWLLTYIVPALIAAVWIFVVIFL